MKSISQREQFIDFELHTVSNNSFTRRHAFPRFGHLTMCYNVQGAYYDIHINNVDSIRGFHLQSDTVHCNTRMLGCDSGKNEKYTPNFCCEI